MTASTVSLLVFLAALGLTMSALYFMVEAPAERRQRRTRLEAMQRSLLQQSASLEHALVREQLVKETTPLQRFLARHPLGSRFERFLQQSGVEASLGQVLSLTAGAALLGAVAGLLMRQPAPMVVLTVLGVGALPLGVVAVRRQKRLGRFEEQFPDAIDLLARAVRAGHAFTTGFELIAKEMPEPLAGEFRIAYDQQNLGLPLRDALASLAERVPLADVKIFISALQIQRETGGNLAEILEKLSYVIRERFKLYRQVRVYTAEGRLSLWVLTAAPPMTAFLIFLVNREGIMPLVTDPLGQRMSWTAVVLLVTGFFVIKKITSIKV
jgi:tight adherence protein B